MKFYRRGSRFGIKIGLYDLEVSKESFFLWKKDHTGFYTEVCGKYWGPR